MRINWELASSPEEYGFSGFVTAQDLAVDMRQIPDVRGVYAVVRASQGEPTFLDVGTGGFFKGKDPNVAASVLRANWVDGTSIVYIGKAGDPGSWATLRSRLRQYLRFGAGANVGHWGGRYIWQLPESDNLIFCWKSLPDGHPSVVETELIASFKQKFGARPFANLTK